MLPSFITTPTKTPTKSYQNVLLSPSSKSKRCILCCKYEWNADYRRKLFHGPGNIKTPAAVRIEQTLGITIDEFEIEIVCKRCVNKIDSIIKAKRDASQTKLIEIEKKINCIKQQYEESIEKLKSAYAHTSEKRLSSDHDVHQKSRKSLKYGAGPLCEVENLDIKPLSPSKPTRAIKHARTQTDFGEVHHAVVKDVWVNMFSFHNYSCLCLNINCIKYRNYGLNKMFR